MPPAGWNIAPSPAPGFVLTVADGAVTFANNGLQAVGVLRPVTVTSGAKLHLEFVGDVTSSASHRRRVC